MDNPGDRSEPRSRSRERLGELLSIMRSPSTKLSLSGWDICENELRAPTGESWRCLNYVPIFFENREARLYPIDHLSNPLADSAKSIIAETPGLVLNLSAGGSESWWPNVVEVEAGIFRNTDIVADAHNLPFVDGVFDACVAMNAFEHYSEPHVAAAEIARVLKPGGRVLIHTAFLQPIHEAPHHYFNATKYGVTKWFEGFEDCVVTTSENFAPLYAISWILSDLMAGLANAGRSQDVSRLSELTIGEIIKFWRGQDVSSLPFDIFNTLPPELADQLAAGVELSGRKPR